MCFGTWFLCQSTLSLSLVLTEVNLKWLNPHLNIPPNCRGLLVKLAPVEIERYIVRWIELLLASDCVASDGSGKEVHERHPADSEAASLWLAEENLFDILLWFYPRCWYDLLDPSSHRSRFSDRQRLGLSSLYTSGNAIIPS